eukprot:gene3983-4613_t
MLPDSDIDTSATNETMYMSTHDNAALEVSQHTQAIASKSDDLIYYEAIERDFGSKNLGHMNLANKYRQLCDTKDYKMREQLIVIAWLEEMVAGVEYNTDVVYWKKTLEALESGQRGLVSSLDPDAPQRLNAPIALEDEKVERAFMATLWTLIRAGNRQLAVEFCVSVGQSWRAATLLGDRRYTNQSDVGNPTRNLWRSACMQLAMHGASDYERAIYGILAGNVYAAFPVCKNYYDHLWVYMRGLVDDTLNEEVLSAPSSLATEDIAPLQPTIATTTTSRDILHTLRTNSPTEIMNEASESYHIIQEKIILDDYASLIMSLLELIQTGKQNSEFLRFAVNLILFYRIRSPYAPVSEDEKSPENKIIYAYVQHLITAQRNDLVAMYTSFLSNGRLRINVYSKFLEGIEKEEEQKRCLYLAERFSLDADTITEMVVKNITTQQSHGVGSKSFSTTTPADVKKIAAVRWFYINPVQRIDAVDQSNLLIREFVESNKIEAAQSLVDDLPSDSVAVARMESTRHESDTTDIIHEFTCWCNYLQANRYIGVWLQNFAKKPQLSTLQFKLTGKESYAQKLDLERRRKAIEEDVLMGTDQVKRSSRICNVVADERLKWYSLFTREQLQEILSLVQKSVLALMEKDQSNDDILSYTRYYFQSNNRD